MTDTTNTNTNTNTAHAAALAMRNAAAALARRLPLYYGSGESADEDLAQAIEDLPLPVDTTDWRTEAEWLRAEVARLSPTEDEIRYTADQDWTGLSGATAWHLAERHGEGWAGIGAMMEAWRDAEVQRITAGLAADLARAQEQAQAERDELAARLAEIEAAEPVGYVSPGQLGLVRDGDGDAGRYMPMRKTQRALFTLPLYARPAPAAAPERADHCEDARGMVSERAEPAANELPTRCTECGQLGWHKFGCSHVAHERGLRFTAHSSDSTSCPKGER